MHDHFQKTESSLTGGGAVYRCTRKQAAADQLIQAINLMVRAVSLHLPWNAWRWPAVRLKR
jgi:hypothetical protein